jgi:hypothetical protein
MTRVLSNQWRGLASGSSRSRIASHHTISHRRAFNLLLNDPNPVMKRLSKESCLRARVRCIHGNYKVGGNSSLVSWTLVRSVKTTDPIEILARRAVRGENQKGNSHRGQRRPIPICHTHGPEYMFPTGLRADMAWNWMGFFFALVGG